MVSMKTHQLLLCYSQVNFMVVVLSLVFSVHMDLFALVIKVMDLDQVTHLPERSLLMK